MADLRIFTDDYEWFVARNLDEALTYQRQVIGENPSQLAEWRLLGPQDDLRIWLNPETGDVAEVGMGVLVSGQAQVWTEAFGAGFLCAREN